MSAIKTPTVVAGRDDEAAASAAFPRMFAADSPYERPFAEAVTHRAIVFPFEYPYSPLPWWTERALLAVKAMATAAGDCGFFRFYSETWVDGEPRTTLVPLDAVPEKYFMGDQGLEEFALYSPAGSWGVMSAKDGWAIVGARTADLLHSFLKVFPPIPDAPRFQHDLHGRVRRLWRPTPWVAPPDQPTVVLSLWEALHETGFLHAGFAPDLLEHIYGHDEAERLLAGWLALR
jgi:hypothetical protein